MSDIHILNMSLDKKTVNCIFHVPIPSTGVNSVGIQWRDAILLELGGSDNVSSSLPNISAEEEALIKSGGIVEKNETVRFSSISVTDSTRLQEIKNKFNLIKNNLLTEKQIELNFIGLSVDAN